MTDTIVADFYARGIPKPQGSKRAFVVNNRAVMTESGGAKHRDWRATVNHAAAARMGDEPPIAGPLRVRLIFFLPRPKSHPKTRRTWPVARPDVDKLARSVADSCTHVVWFDDSQIVWLEARKVWAGIDEPGGAGVRITVWLIEEDDE